LQIMTNQFAETTLLQLSNQLMQSKAINP